MVCTLPKSISRYSRTSCSIGRFGHQAPPPPSARNLESRNAGIGLTRGSCTRCILALMMSPTVPPIARKGIPPVFYPSSPPRNWWFLWERNCYLFSAKPDVSGKYLKNFHRIRFSLRLLNTVFISSEDVMIIINRQDSTRTQVRNSFLPISSPLACLPSQSVYFVDSVAL